MAIRVPTTAPTISIAFYVPSKNSIIASGFLGLEDVFSS
jgi:hypothetical protein